MPLETHNVGCGLQRRDILTQLAGQHDRLSFGSSVQASSRVCIDHKLRTKANVRTGRSHAAEGIAWKHLSLMFSAETEGCAPALVAAW